MWSPPGAEGIFIDPLDIRLRQRLRQIKIEGLNNEFLSLSLERRRDRILAASRKQQQQKIKN
jgi:hypothetical protein